MKLTTMTVTKCAECPFYYMEATCNHPEVAILIRDAFAIHHRCPIAQGKPFNISFTPLNESNGKPETEW